MPSAQGRLRIPLLRELIKVEQMINLRNIMLLVAIMMAMFLGGCYPRTEVESTPCDKLGKVTDPAIKADLEKRCGRGGPEFKPTPHKAY